MKEYPFWISQRDKWIHWELGKPPKSDIHKLIYHRNMRLQMSIWRKEIAKHKKSIKLYKSIFEI